MYSERQEEKLLWVLREPKTFKRSGTMNERATVASTGTASRTMEAFEEPEDEGR